MRFVELNLERYGRFEDCRLEFATRAPDLHVLLGANEAGKTTAMAAISDLLFGFPSRSPYNFKFDYPLLRIGATLEEDGTTFRCRRRKASSGSLVDSDDRPLSEGPLLAMVRGQTRDTFHVGFSLDQTRLRAGGKMIVDARDDIGRAMFAAGSGLTGISEALNELQVEADAIWGPRASGRRTYTIAEREFEEANRTLRDTQLRPRTWTDARDSYERLRTQLSQLEEDRAGKTAERTGVERLRRVGSQLLLRAELMEQLQAADQTVILTPQVEETAERAIFAAEAASREVAKAAELVEDVKKRLAGLNADADVLDVADRIEALVDDRGGVIKGRKDVAGLEGQLKVARDQVARIRRDLGEFAGDPPAKLTISRMRALGRRYGEESARREILTEAMRQTELLLEQVTARIPEHDSGQNLAAFAPALEAARALGKDVDQRLVELSRKADRSEAEEEAVLKQLTPWTGSFSDLHRLPPITEEEVVAAQSKIQGGVDAVRDADSEIRRVEEELERAVLRRSNIETASSAVSAEALADARSARDTVWSLIRGHVCGGNELQNPGATADEFEQSVVAADALADGRFNSAEASAQLVELDSSIEVLRLRQRHASQSKDAAMAEHQQVTAAWTERLSHAGLPDFSPERFRTWSRTRSEALSLHDAADESRRSADLLKTQLEAARDQLLALPGIAAGRDDPLARVLEKAEKILSEHETELRALETNRAELKRLQKQSETDRRNIELIEGELSSIAAEWEGARTSAGVNLEIGEAEMGLGLLDELGTAEEQAAALERRIRSIRNDEDAFAAAVADLAAKLSIKPDAEVMTTFELMRRRLSAAQEVASTQARLEAERDGWEAEGRAAKADWNAAVNGVGDVLKQCRLSEFSDLSAAIEASRSARKLKEALETTEQQITSSGDGIAIAELASSWTETTPDELTRRSQQLHDEITDLNERITETANALGDARRTFESLESGTAASDAAADAAQARAEMEVLAENYLLKRSEALLLKWAMEKYRERRQDPLLTRASNLFSKLTLGRYAELKVDYESPSPRLLGLCDDGATLVDVDAMSEGTTDQLFLALRLAAVEQSIAAGIRIPFLADDLFVNFDDDRAAAGFEVLAELARSTQVLFFTHHDHLSKIAANVIKQPEIALCLPR